MLKESIWGYGMLSLGIVAIAVIWFFANTTRTDQHNYYLLKETTEAAMIDAIDLAMYRYDGTIRIEEEKFVENFIRRFAQSADLSNVYEIEIYDINEEPPKVSLKVVSRKSTNAGGETVTYNLTNNIDAILETKYSSICKEVKTASESANSSNFVDISEPYAIGKEYRCEVGPGIFYNFYVLGYDDTTGVIKENARVINLIMAQNLNLDMKIEDEVTSTYKGNNFAGTKRYEALQELTQNWTYIDAVGLPVMAQLMYANGETNSSRLKSYANQSFNMDVWEKIAISDGYTSWVSDEKDSATDLKYSLSNAKWLYNDLIDATDYSVSATTRRTAYWLNDQVGDFLHQYPKSSSYWYGPKGMCVYGDGYVWAGSDKFAGYDCGIRPVISIYKKDF